MGSLRCMQRRLLVYETMRARSHDAANKFAESCIELVRAPLETSRCVLLALLPPDVGRNLRRKLPGSRRWSLLLFRQDCCCSLCYLVVYVTSYASFHPSFDGCLELQLRQKPTHVISTFLHLLRYPPKKVNLVLLNPWRFNQ